MILPEYPSLYFDTLMRFALVVEHWLYRSIIRGRIKAIRNDLRRPKSTDVFFTISVLDEGDSYMSYYFLADRLHHIRREHNRYGRFYLSRVGGFLVQIEPRGTALSDHPDDGLTTPVLRRLLKALEPAYQEAVARRRDDDWQKGEYVAW